MRENKVFLQINNTNDNKKLIDYLLEFKVSKSYINNLFSLKKISLNEQILKNGEIILKTNDIIEICLPIDSVEPYKKNIDILYEDDFIIVVNKPANILVHSDGVSKETMTNAVNWYFMKKKEACCAYPIHRLDYETTGILIFAKNRLALSYLSVAIESHEVKKEYVCLCRGNFNKDKGEISSSIGKDRHSNKQIISKTGKPANSKYKVLENGKISKVKVQIDHGRKHQIRVHLASINHPIIGDKLYGKNETEGLKLHFYKVEFRHPVTKKKIRIECKEDF